MGWAFIVNTWLPTALSYLTNATGSNIFLVDFSAKNFTCLITGRGSDFSVTIFLIVLIPINKISSTVLAFTSFAKNLFCADSFVLPFSLSDADEAELEFERAWERR